MAVANTNKMVSFTKVMKESIQDSIKKLVEEEIESVVKEIEIKIKKQIDKIALNIFSCYTFNDMGDRLVIEVKKEVG